MDVQRQRASADCHHGFTMVELVVVVAVLAVLMAIAVPSLLGARKPAQDKQAETILHTSLVAARIGASDQGDYTWVTPATMQANETSVKYLLASVPAHAGASQVSVDAGTQGIDSYVILTTQSASGKCYAVLVHSTLATQYQSPSGLSGCSADAFDPATGWQVNGW
jgi:type IV pilus assembly protein PilA